MIARIVALVVAVAMVVGAIALRARWDDDGDASDGGRSGPLQLVCAPEVEVACQRILNETEGDIEITIEPAGVTADRLAGAQRADVDGWLTPGPWPEIVEVLRQGRPAVFAEIAGPLAHGAAGLVMWNDRAARLTASCGGQVTWACLGESAGQPWTARRGEEAWGIVKFAVPDPTSTAAGLAVLGAGTVGVVGHADVALVDLEDERFGNWLSNLARTRAPVDLEAMLAQGPAAAAGLTTLDAVAEPVLGEAARRNEVKLIYPAPVTTVGVVLGSVPGSRGDRLAQLVEEHGPRALRSTGWDAQAGAPLPPPGLLQALRGRWADVR